jgi:aquaporin Z
MSSKKTRNQKPAEPQLSAGNSKSALREIALEAIGSLWLVASACGTAVFSGLHSQPQVGFLSIAIATGFAAIGAGYCLGPDSRCQFNPALTIAFWVAGRIGWTSVIRNIVAQVVAGCVAVLGIVKIANSSGALGPVITQLIANGYADHSPGGYNMAAAALSESFVAVFFAAIVLGSSSRRAVPSTAPIAMGVTYPVAVLVLGPITNASVNPAKSTAAALWAGGWAMDQLWLFWFAPVLGAVAGGLIYRFLQSDTERE